MTFLTLSSIMVPNPKRLDKVPCAVLKLNFFIVNKETNVSLINCDD